MTSKQAVLVTGGAGYIGSHVVLALQAAGYRVVVLDDLSTGRPAAVPPGVPLVVGDIADAMLISRTIASHRIRSVLHFAGSIVVPESVENPVKYYTNNTAGSLALLAAAAHAGVERVIFSSTAAVYGDPAVVPVAEDAPLAPINPYGASKLMTERMLADIAAASGLRFAVLRYFNVAGADLAGRTGQSTPRATHLIKVACEVALGLRQHLDIFGTGYATPDGTCVRDYIHVTDLADAHVLALAHLERGRANLTLNCGYGRGASVREVVAAVERVTGRPLPVVEGSPRAGDPPCLIAAADRIRKILGWVPVHDHLDDIVATALAWERHLRPGMGRVA